MVVVTDTPEVPVRKTERKDAPRGIEVGKVESMPAALAQKAQPRSAPLTTVQEELAGLLAVARFGPR